MSGFLASLDASPTGASFLAVPLQFWLGYAAIIAVPGPNSFLIGATAAVRGFRGTFPVIVALSLGATTLALALAILVAASIDHAPMQASLPFLSAALLLAAAWRIATLRRTCPDDAPQKPQGRIAECVLAFSCGMLNPVTASYFASQLLAGAAPQGAMMFTTLGLGVLAMAVGCTSVLGLLLSVPTVRCFVGRHLGPIRTAVAGLFCLMAFVALMPS